MGNTINIKDMDLVRKAAKEFQTSGQELGTIAKRVDGADWGAAQAGRNYAADGASISDGIERVAKVLNAWATSAKGAGDTLVSSMDQYEAQDKAGQQRTNAAGSGLF